MSFLEALGGSLNGYGASVSGGAEPPQVIGVRIEMSSSYAVYCMLHAVLYALC